MPSKAVALALSTHPGPAVAVTAIAVILGVGVGLPAERVVLLGAAVLANQASVGLSNDWIDADRDAAVGRADKPVAQGLISVAAVRQAAWLCALASIALTLPLGWAATVAHAAFVVSAWLYNAGLKSTVFSVVPYVVSFGLLPLVVTLSLPTPAGAAWWAMAAGSALGIAAHFANVLPDLDDDQRTGVRGLPHRLGRRTAGVLTYGVLVAASLLVVLGPPGAPGPLGWICLAVMTAIAAVGVTLVLTRPPTRVLFQLIMLSAVLDVALLAAAGSELVA